MRAAPPMTNGVAESVKEVRRSWDVKFAACGASFGNGSEKANYLRRGDTRGDSVE